MTEPVNEEVPSDMENVGGEGEKGESQKVGALKEGMRRLSVSPPRDRESPLTCRSYSPPPPAAPPTPTAQTGLPRTFSSPSLMDSSPKIPSKHAFKSPHSPAQRHFVRPSNELTPVTRNTTGQYVDEGNVVSPEDTSLLSGQHLALPSQPDTMVGARPPLRRRMSPPACATIPMSITERSKSLENIAALQDDEECYNEPVKFPSKDRQHVSFTSQQQYQASVSPMRAQAGLKPYQPTREKVGSFSGEELERIYRSIPIDDRQYSIPSIRLANHLNGSATTSFTDEEIGLGFDDDASLSSRGSSLFMPGDEEDDGGGAPPVAKLRLGTATTPSAAMIENYHLDMTSSSSEDEQRKSRVKKRTKKDQKALDWLRSVESDAAITEAASSKFLTSKPTPVQRRRSYHRNASLPEHESPSIYRPEAPPSQLMVERWQSYRRKTSKDSSED